MKRNLFLILLSVILLSSCMMTRTNVGTYRQMPGEEYTFSKGKQVYLFWGLLPLGYTNVATPDDGNCQIRTYHNFWDFLLSAVTAGIFDMQTIKVKAKRPAQTGELIPPLNE